jgi:hypothetical protein
MAARLANTTPSVDLFINNGVKREAETKNSVIIASI